MQRTYGAGLAREDEDEDEDEDEKPDSPMKHVGASLGSDDGACVHVYAQVYRACLRAYISTHSQTRVRAHRTHAYAHAHTRAGTHTHTQDPRLNQNRDSRRHEHTQGHRLSFRVGASTCAGRVQDQTFELHEGRAG